MTARPHSVPFRSIIMLCLYIAALYRLSVPQVNFSACILMFVIHTYIPLRSAKRDNGTTASRYDLYAFGFVNEMTPHHKTVVVVARAKRSERRYDGI